MLSKEENEILTKVSPGTPMGELMRQYWLPILLSSELASPDCNPIRVRLLGEELIGFRDTSGKVGLLAENCPHRGASLFFGRNEEGGLRCVYHGWKYDVEGRCVDMPNEPPESNFKEKIRHVAYPCREQNGMIWTYMGPRKEPPGFPGLEWAMVPEAQRHITPFVRECNWMQALEGDIDTSHTRFLHSRIDPQESHRDFGHYYREKAPRFEVLDAEYGLLIGAKSRVDDKREYWRISQFVMPIFPMFPPSGRAAVPSHVWIPMDDVTTLVWAVRWNPSRPLADVEGVSGHRFSGPGEYLSPTAEPAGAWRMKANASNDYLIDYEAQRTKRFSGVPTIALQDQAMTCSMGAVSDRTKEHLGTTDAAIIKARRCLINAAKELRDHGVTPPGVDNPELFRVRSASVILRNNTDWVRATADYRKAFSELPILSAGPEGEVPKDAIGSLPVD